MKFRAANSRENTLSLCFNTISSVALIDLSKRILPLILEPAVTLLLKTWKSVNKIGAVLFVVLIVAGTNKLNPFAPPKISSPVEVLIAERSLKALPCNPSCSSKVLISNVNPFCSFPLTAMRAIPLGVLTQILRFLSSKIPTIVLLGNPVRSSIVASFFLFTVNTFSPSRVATQILPDASFKKVMTLLLLSVSKSFSTCP
ncbi:hypothetical protein D3C72_666280 [compost metagenome]